MKTRKIRLKTVEDVREFVQTADRCSFAVSIPNGEARIDAKSIMGVMSLDLTKDLEVLCEGEDPDLERVFTEYAAE